MVVISEAQPEVTVESADRSRERPSRVPVNLYRLQLHRGFTFDNARAVVPYLAALGVTDFYSSPFLTAGRGSTHGYDIADHGTLNEELGGESAYNALSEALARAEMGFVLDVVPNHMGVEPERNHWWRDVLENGPSSIYARFFDIDWTPIKPELTDKVLLPILGDQYGAVLERGELQLGFHEGALILRYFDRVLPLNPRRSVVVLKHDVERLRDKLGDEDSHLREFLSIITSQQNLPPATERDPDKMIERHREKEVARERLMRLAESSADLREHIERAIAVWNGTPGDTGSFDRLHALLDEQNYRLAYWRTASDEINYRRFFDVNELAGVRMEDPAVFEATHGLILRLIGEGKVTGLRVDHPDGLADPIDYVARLQAHVRDLLAARGGPRPGGGRKPFYVSVEKILSANEELPAPWAVHGTTTYSFLNEVNGLFVDTKNAVSMRRIYGRLTGHRESFQTLMYHSKRFIMTSAMASELAVLAHALNDISESHRRSRDFTMNGLRKALTEVIACFPVYRTYVSARGASDTDRHVIHLAIARARRRNPAMESTIFDFIQSVLLPPAPLDDPTPEGEADRQRRLAFAMKFQQYTGPVHAKGVEDTSFYRYNVLVSLNEVGGDPERFGRTPADFHEANRRRLEHWPLEMIGTATHDTKRGEDVRARINVLSEIPDTWRKAVSRWTRITGSARTRVEGDHAPDRNDEYLFYQTLIGTWPAEDLDAPVPREASEEYTERIRAYMRKAIKEAKAHTSWVNENQPYEKALDDFVTTTLRGSAAPAFLAAFVPLQRQVARFGAINSLSQLVLRMTSPGVVDFYQGNELWDFHLVDPDNRQPVDFASRQAMLDELSAAPPDFEALLAAWPDGRIKMCLAATLLRLRRDMPELWLEGAYQALRGGDAVSDRHLVAFARQHGSRVAVVVAPRFLHDLMPSATHWPPIGFDVWKTIHVELPEGLAGASFQNALTGAAVRPLVSSRGAMLPAADLFKTLPVAVLLADGNQSSSSSDGTSDVR